MLETAAGSGVVTRALAPRLAPDARYVVTDLNQPMLEYAATHDLPTDQVTRLGMPDRLIAHATRKEQLTEVGLDPTGIARSVRDAVRSATPPKPQMALVGH